MRRKAFVLACGLALGCSDSAGGTAAPGDSSVQVPGDAHVSADASAEAAASSLDASKGGSDAAVGSDAATDPHADAAQLDALCPSAASYPNPLPNNPVAQLVQGGFGFLEGPVWLADQGVLLFSDMDFSTNNSALGPSSQIRRLAPPSTFDVFVASSGSNGLALDAHGDVLAATHDVQSLSLFDAHTGARTMRPLLYMGKHWSSPNDLAVRSDGNVYVTDPDWQLGSRTSETGMRGVYRVAPDDSVTLIDGTLNQPNGITLSPDETKLYVTSLAAEVRVYDVHADGTVGAGKTFTSTAGGGDGMAIDCAGNLYVTSGNVEVFDSTGQKLGEIDVAETAANAAFGAPDRKTLYITARTGLYAIPLAVPGLPY